MHVTSILWKEHQTRARTKADPIIVFTTESVNIVRERHEFINNATLRQGFPFPLNFVTNSKDVTPDTGFAKSRPRVNFTADEAMLSAISSLKAQMATRVTIGNCCSNFHTLLGDFLAEGLGATTENTFACLQEMKDPEYQVCCGWFRGCKERRAEALRNRSLTMAA
jgi:hypothetical protein